MDGAPWPSRPALDIRKDLIPAALIDEAVQTLRDLVAAAGSPVGDLDDQVSALAVRDRSRLGAVYDAMRETAVFRRIVTCESLLEAARIATGARRLHSPFQHCVFRMDLAGEAWRGFGWHQDYAYNMLSEEFVTAWLPLTPAGQDNGSIDAAPAASDQIYPVDIRVKRNEAGASLGTRDAFICERFHPRFEACAVKLELQPGDVALFHNRLVHRSGFNPGPRHRYSIQARFGDLLAPGMAARGWRNRLADGFDAFKALRPELVASEESP
jgi:ectoine hydroxylase-related dioxygenase (phytanoyl-CoA dioxygenase family)